MESNPIDGAAAGWWSDDVDHHRPLVEESQKGCGAAVRDDGSVATGQHSGQVTTPPVDAWPSERVDAMEDPVELVGSHRMGDCVVAHPLRAKLIPRHQPALPFRELRHALGPIGATFGPHSHHKSHR